MKGVPDMDGGNGYTTINMCNTTEPTTQSKMMSILYYVHFITINSWQLSRGKVLGEGGEGIEQKKRENTHGHVRQCGDCQGEDGREKVEEGMGDER